MALRVAYIVDHFPRLSETLILNEILELERQGVGVTVYSLLRPGDDPVHDGVGQIRAEVIEVPELKAEPALELFRQAWPDLKTRRDHLLPLVEEALLQPSTQGLRELVQALFIAQVFEQHGGVDHTHAHSVGAGWVARIIHHLSGVPYSFTAYPSDIYRGGVDVPRFRRLIYDAAFVSTMCEANKTFIELKLLERPELKLRRLYPGIDLDAFAGDRTPESEPPLILAVGSLAPRKGFHVLLRACATLRDQHQPFACIVVGEGPEHERLKADRQQLKLESSVELLGARPHDVVRQLLKRASVVCLPCVTAADGDRDALPIVLLEALAAGVPAVSTPVGGIPEIFGEGEGGVLVHENNAFALATAIRFLLGNSSAAAKLGSQGRARAERLFDLRQSVAELHTLMKHGTPGEGSTVKIVDSLPPRPVLDPS